jgi:hypothetical protein
VGRIDREGTGTTLALGSEKDAAGTLALTSASGAKKEAEGVRKPEEAHDGSVVGMGSGEVLTRVSGEVMTTASEASEQVTRTSKMAITFSWTSTWDVQVFPSRRSAGTKIHFCGEPSNLLTEMQGQGGIFATGSAIKVHPATNGWTGVRYQGHLEAQKKTRLAEGGAVQNAGAPCRAALGGFTE